MTKRERVGITLAHREPDRVPTGEISIEAGFANRLLGTTFPDDYQHYERDRQVRERLDIDYVNIGDWPAYDLGVDERGYRVYRSAYGDQYAVAGRSRHTVRPLVASMDEARSYQTPDPRQIKGEMVRTFAADRDMFVFGQIGGPITILDEALGMEDYMIAALENTSEIQFLSEAVMTWFHPEHLQRAHRCRAACQCHSDVRNRASLWRVRQGHALMAQARPGKYRRPPLVISVHSEG